MPELSALDDISHRIFFFEPARRTIHSVIPVTLREWKKVKELKGQGVSSMSGEVLDLFGYPEDVYSADVMTIINNNISNYIR